MVELVKLVIGDFVDNLSSEEGESGGKTLSEVLGSINYNFSRFPHVPYGSKRFGRLENAYDENDNLLNRRKWGEENSTSDGAFELARSTSYLLRKVTEEEKNELLLSKEALIKAQEEVFEKAGVPDKLRDRLYSIILQNGGAFPYLIYPLVAGDLILNMYPNASVTANYVVASLCAGHDYHGSELKYDEKTGIITLCFVHHPAGGEQNGSLKYTLAFDTKNDSIKVKDIEININKEFVTDIKKEYLPTSGAGNNPKPQSIEAKNVNQCINFFLSKEDAKCKEIGGNLGKIFDGWIPVGEESNKKRNKNIVDTLNNIYALINDGNTSEEIKNKCKETLDVSVPLLPFLCSRWPEDFCSIFATLWKFDRYYAEKMLESSVKSETISERILSAFPAISGSVSELGADASEVFCKSLLRGAARKKLFMSTNISTVVPGIERELGKKITVSRLPKDDKSIKDYIKFYKSSKDERYRKVGGYLSEIFYGLIVVNEDDKKERIKKIDETLKAIKSFSEEAGDGSEKSKRIKNSNIAAYKFFSNLAQKLDYYRDKDKKPSKKTAPIIEEIKTLKALPSTQDLSINNEDNKKERGDESLLSVLSNSDFFRFLADLLNRIFFRDSEDGRPKISKEKVDALMLSLGRNFIGEPTVAGDHVHSISIPNLFDMIFQDVKTNLPPEHFKLLEELKNSFEKQGVKKFCFFPDGKSFFKDANGNVARHPFATFANWFERDIKLPENGFEEIEISNPSADTVAKTFSREEVVKNMSIFFAHKHKAPERESRDENSSDDKFLMGNRLSCFERF